MTGPVTRIVVCPGIRRIYRVTWDGRLDNRADIARRARLSLSSQTADAALVVAAYAAAGPAILPELMGEFAFVLYDAESSALPRPLDLRGPPALLHVHDVHGNAAHARGVRQADRRVRTGARYNHVGDYVSAEMLRRNRQLPAPWGEAMNSDTRWRADGSINTLLAPSANLATESRATPVYVPDSLGRPAVVFAGTPYASHAPAAPRGYVVGANPSPTIPVVSGVLADLRRAAHAERKAVIRRRERGGQCSE